MSVIAGVGIDICGIARMQRAVERHGERFLVRIFTPAERDYVLARAHPYQSFAARFAAKEATSKALGAPRGIGWHDVEVVPARPREAGPTVVLMGRAKEVADERAVREVHLSLTHAEGFAAAMVVLEGSLS